MDIGLKAKLRDRIEKFISDEDEASRHWWPVVFIHPELADQMAEAAAQVFDAMVRSQEYYLHENPPEAP